MKFSIKKILFVFFILSACIAGSYAQDSCRYRISLLTCSPGEDLYSTFGHSALRVTDNVTQSDVVYNYGTFNFEEDGFYLKFTRGKLRYYLSSEDFQSFAFAYEYDGRGMTEQVLNLNCEEKNKLLRFLHDNIKEENKYYKYDFTFDNCTTRLRDIIRQNADDSVKFGSVLKSQSSFRDLIYEYLDYNDKQWSKLGIDLLLGARLDQHINGYQSMFLPDYLMNTFDVSKIRSGKLVAPKISLLPNKFGPVEHNWLSDPFSVLLILMLLVIAASLSKSAPVKNLLLAFDGFLVFMTGLLGILFIVMWVGTEHFMVRDNYNLLWAWPMNAVMAFYINSTGEKTRLYFWVYAVFLCLLVILWAFLPQHLNLSILPILGILIFRIFFIHFKGEKYETPQLGRK